MKKMKKLLALFMAFAMVISLAACGDGNSSNNETGGGEADDSSSVDTENTGDAEQEAAVPGEMDAEQYYNTYLGSDPTSLDVSLRTDSYSSTILTNTMEGLVRVEAENDEYVVRPGDAQTWESNEDGTVWTFHLGDNKWSDGEPVTAEQYVYSLQRSADPATGCPNGWFLSPVLNYDAIAAGDMAATELGVKAVDEKTLEITLSAATPAFLQMINATIYYPQREDKMTEWGEKYGTEAQYTMCNGPYVLEEWTHNSKLVLKKNPNYWNVDNVKMETVNIMIIADVAAVNNAYQSGELDYIGVSTQEYLDQFQSDPDSKYDTYTTANMTFNFYNTKDKVFSNAKIRKAFSLCIDHEDINEMCFGGLRVPTYGWVVPTISVGETNYREAAGDILLDQKAALESEGKTAQDLLLEGMEEAGLGSDPSTLDVTLSLAGTDDWFRTYGEYLQQVYLTELGVNLKIDFSEWGIFSDNLQTGNYQMGYMSWGAYYNDPYDVLSAFYSDYDQCSTGWGNAEYDKLVKEASVEMDEQKRLDLYIQAETMLLDDAVICPLATGQYNDFYKSYMFGYEALGFSTNGYKDLYTSGR